MAQNRVQGPYDPNRDPYAQAPDNPYNVPTGGINPFPATTLQPASPSADGNTTDRTTNIGPWAQGYGQQPSNVSVPGKPAPNPGVPTTYGAQTNWADPNNLRGYFQSRGINDPSQLDRLVGTWTGYHQQFGAKDPNYFWTRIQAENDLIGGPQNSPFRSNDGTQAGAPSSSPFIQKIREMLMRRMGQASQPVTEGDPTIEASVGAAKLQGERTNEQTRKALAERLYASGQGTVDTNAINQGAMASEERLATGLGTLRAQMMQQEVQRRSQELQTLLQQAIASGDAEMARMIQTHMAQLEAQLRREGYGLQMSMFQQGENNKAVA